MAEALARDLSRELILPAVRLDVPPRPSSQQLAALAERSVDEWTSTPLDLATAQVVRLAVAQLLLARLAPAPGRGEQHPVPTDPEQATLAQLAGLFRPHVSLSAQAFELAVVEAVNSGVPAAVDPVREGLRRVGVTGRDALRVVALGLDKLPGRARSGFWDGVKGSTTVTAVVDALAGRGAERPHDVSGLDRSELARADALVLAGGRVTPVSFSARPADGRRSWLSVPLSVVRHRHSGPGGGSGGGQGAGQGGDVRRGGEPVVEVALRGEGWVEAFETALDAVSSAMQQIDTGGRPRGRVPALAEAVAARLVAARERTVADVVASLRGIDPFALELFDHQVTTASVPVAVPAVEDDLFVQLWLPTSALAGPLVTGAVDLFLGGTPDVRQAGGRPPAKQLHRPGAPASKQVEGRPRGGGRPQPQPQAPRPPGEGAGAGRSRRGRRGKPAAAGAATPGEPADAPADAPVDVPGSAPADPPADAPTPTPEAPAAPAPEPTPTGESPATTGIPAPEAPGSIQ